jgi:hypothetical protein
MLGFTRFNPTYAIRFVRQAVSSYIQPKSGDMPVCKPLSRSIFFENFLSTKNISQMFTLLDLANSSTT